MAHCFNASRASTGLTWFSSWDISSNAWSCAYNSAVTYGGVVFIWSTTPMITPFPSVTEPARPLFPAIMQNLPNLLLCPIWTKLSILQPSPKTVELNFPRSIQEFAPISTLLPMITLPICGILPNLFVDQDETQNHQHQLLHWDAKYSHFQYDNVL
jgi:hypothetical protein